MDEKLVVCDALSKSYGTKRALDGISLGLEKGKIIGLLGPNGSGKTTLVKILAGLLSRDGGEALIDGMEVSERTKAVVSYLPERTYFNSWMSVNECLEMFKDFYEDFDIERARSMLIDLGVEADAKLRTLSKGTKEKVQLVLVMARRARLYLLDEPIAGVDPSAREYIIDTIIKNHNEESTILISTHLITDIETALDEYIFIHNGKIFERGTPASVMEKHKMTLDAYFREVFKYVR